MKKRMYVVLASIAVLLLSVVAVPVSAQTSSTTSTTGGKATANSLRIAPVRTDLEVNPGESKQVTVYAQNLTANTVSVRGIVSDFEPSKDESGQPLVILDDSYAKSHSLKRLAAISPNILTLAPNQRSAVTVTITAPKSAMAGGYYGAVRFVSADQVSPNGTGVAVSATLGSLVLLRITGETEEKVTLASLDVRKDDKAGTFFTTNKNLQAVARFENQGNVQLAPFGKVQLLNRSGKVIEEHEINNTDPRGNVLPDSIRRFSIELQKVGSFGRYTLQGNFGYGTNGELLTSKVSFWVVPVPLMVGAGVGLLAIILLAVLIPRMVRRYNRRIISRAGRRY